jgi:hypothetical protein
MRLYHLLCEPCFVTVFPNGHAANGTPDLGGMSPPFYLSSTAGVWTEAICLRCLKTFTEAKMHSLGSVLANPYHR